MSSELSTLKTTKLTKLERKWFKEYLNSFNATDALRKAYPDNTYTPDSERSIAYQTRKSVFSKLHISDNDLMDMVGLDDDSLYNTTKEGLKATKPILTPQGIKAVPDYGVRHKYLETTLKLRGKLMDTSRVELTGEDGGPIKFNVLAGIGFIPPKE